MRNEIYGDRAIALLIKNTPSQKVAPEASQAAALQHDALNEIRGLENDAVI